MSDSMAQPDVWRFSEPSVAGEGVVLFTLTNLHSLTFTYIN